MGFRTGLLVGLGAGYYLGARAGRQRYEQIQKLLKKAQRSDVVSGATDKAKAVVDLGVERAKDLTNRKQGNGSGTSTDSTSPLVVEVPVPSTPPTPPASTTPPPPPDVPPVTPPPAT
jgi:hypothetical protein